MLLDDQLRGYTLGVSVPGVVPTNTGLTHKLY